MYKVIEMFTDLGDNERRYEAGDTYPRKGLVVTKERYAELAGDKNKRGIPLIVEEKPEVKGAAPKAQDE